MVIVPRIVNVGWLCRQCDEVVGPGEVIWPVRIGPNETYACTDCAWKHEDEGDGQATV